MRGARFGLQSSFEAKNTFVVLAIIIFTFVMSVYLTRLYDLGVLDYRMDKLSYADFPIAEGTTPVGEITEGVIIRQEFPNNAQAGISVHTATWGRSGDGDIRFLVTGENTETQYAEVVMNAANIPDNGDVDIIFTRRPDSQDNKLLLTASASSTPGNAVTIWTTENDTIHSSALTVNGMEQTGDLMIREIREEHSQTFWSLLFLIIFAVLGFVSYILEGKIVRFRKLQALLGFMLLYFLYSFRAPEDFLTPYLWAEDGVVLIQESIFYGPGSIFRAGNGAYWFIQKIIALLCYRVSLLSGGMSVLPQLQGIITKMIATCSIFYFTSDRFQWIIKERKWRFGICALIILMLPQNSYDVITCDTSLPFALNFTVFLMGLDYVCGEKPKMLSWADTIFLTVMALSTAAVPFVAAVAGLAAFRWGVAEKKADAFTASSAARQGGRVLIVFAATLYQLQLIISSARVSTDYTILKRLFLNCGSFVLFPYWQMFHSIPFFLLGTAAWIALAYIARLQWKPLVFSLGYSFLFLLFCSMTASPEDAYIGAMTGRYVFLSFEISALMVGFAVHHLLRRRNTCNPLGIAVLVLVAAIAIPTYHVETIGANYAHVYSEAITTFQKKGDDQVIIPIGPWDPWRMIVPANISEKIVSDDLNIVVKSVNSQALGSSIIINGNTNVLSIPVSGTASTKEGQAYEHLLLKHGNQYLWTFYIDHHRDNQNLVESEFIFQVPGEWFTDGSTLLELVGKTPDGNYHCSVVSLNTTIVE